MAKTTQERQVKAEIERLKREKALLLLASQKSILTTSGRRVNSARRRPREGT